MGPQLAGGFGAPHLASEAPEKVTRAEKAAPEGGGGRGAAMHPELSAWTDQGNREPLGTAHSRPASPLFP